MRNLGLAVLFGMALGVSAAETPAKPADPFAARLTFTAPDGWHRVDYANASGNDPVLKFEKGADSIIVRLFGGKGSSYRTPERFFSGPAAGTMGKAPDAAGTADVGGKTTALYSHQYPLDGQDPHAVTARPERFATETFCVLPPFKDGRFAVLSYARESAVPDPDEKGEKAWRAFLKTVKPVTPPKKKR